jgi:hypothetical protein
MNNQWVVSGGTAQVSTFLDKEKERFIIILTIINSIRNE